MHLRWRSFEQSPATARKQGVSAEQAAVSVVRQVSKGMPGNGDYFELCAERFEPDRLAPAQGLSEGCDRLRHRTKDLSRIVFQQTRHTALMIGMMVRDQDGRQRQPLALKKFKNGSRVARIDHNRGSALAQQPDVVILERWNPDDVKHGLIVEELRKMSNHGIDDWLDTPQGRYVMAWEQDKIDAVVVDLFGYNALQLGLPQLDLLAHNRIPLRQTVSESGGANVRCDFHELPFAANSIDLVVMPHVLEFHDDPHQILREVERVLIPDGQLVITGFNPISLWGARQRLSRRHDGFPSNGHYLSVLRLKDWLQLLSFEVERGNFGCYAPPCHSRRWLRRWHFMESAGDRWWSFAGGVYLLRAVKRVRGMRLIMPPWNQKKVPQKALTTVTQKEIKQRES